MGEPQRDVVRSMVAGRGPVKALLWKEWRTQRSLVLAALATATVLPAFLAAGAMAGAGLSRMHELANALVPLYALLVWPLFAAATAGTAFAADMGDGSMKFLLSRPVSRARVWLIKMGVGLGAFALVVAGTTFVGVVFIWLSAANSNVFANVMRRDFVDSFEVEALVLAVPFLFVFGCAAYCSVLVKRPMVAALGGLLLAGGMSAVCGFVWLALAMRSPRIADAMFIVGVFVGVPLATVGVYGAAFRTFLRGDIFGGEARRRAWRPLLAITALVLMVVPVPAAYVGMRAMASIAANGIGNLGVAGDAVVVPQISPGGFTTALVRRPLDGGASSILVAENATNPTMSPDGEWIVFTAYGGSLPGLLTAPHLRAVRIDGTDDRSISGPLPGWVWGLPTSILVAPDNDRIAFVGYENVLVTSISGGPESAVELAISENEGSGGGVIGWTAGGALELLYYRMGPRLRRTPAPGGSVAWAGSMLETELLAFDPATGESRLLREFAGRHHLQVGSGYRYSNGLPSRPWTWLPVWLRHEEGNQLHLVDVGAAGGGEMIDVSPSGCGNWGFSPSGARFVYTSCTGDLRTGDAHAEVRIRDLVSNTDELFAELEGYALAAGAGEMFLSPDGGRLVFYARRGRAEQHGTHLVGSDGTARLIAAGYVPQGWRNNTEVVLSRVVDRRFELHVVNVDTGQVKVVFP